MPHDSRTQLTYLLEFLHALGPAAEDFVVAGAQAMKFSVARARGTKDFDFLLNVMALRKETRQLAAIFDKLGYQAVPESRNFQFEKSIPGSAETMRIEFMAPDEYKREKDFRVDIQFTRAPALVARSLSFNRTHANFLANFRTAKTSRQPFA
jgi:hypothetical protein